MLILTCFVHKNGKLLQNIWSSEKKVVTLHLEIEKITILLILKTNYYD